MKKFLLSIILISSFAVSNGQHIPRLIEEIFPQFMQGATPTNIRRVPFVCRMTIDSLLPNTTYRYINRAVLDTPANGLTNAGAGTSIFVTTSGNFIRQTNTPTSFNNSLDYAEFTTNSNGRYTGWFVLEATGNSRFAPGNNLFFTVVINDGAGGTAFSKLIRSVNTIRVIDSAAASPNNARGLRSTPATNATAMNLVMLYDNEAGTGRPISGTLVENDETIGGSYADFYVSQVNGIDKAWGTVIPTNLANGIRRISQFDRLTGNFINSSNSATGMWAAVGGGMVTTVNAVGTTAIALDGSIVTLPVLFKTISGSAASQGNTIFWSVGNAINMVSFEIERSIDGTNYKSIHTIATGNKEDFSFLDANFTTKAFYRIKTLDNQGRATYSNVIFIEGKTISQAFSFYPNPVKNFINLQHQEVKEVTTVSIISLQGVRHLQVVLPMGATQSQINISNLNFGTYLLQFNNGKQTKTQKLVKQ